MMIPVKDIEKALKTIFDQHSEVRGMMMPALVNMVIGKVGSSCMEYVAHSKQVTEYLRASKNYVIVSGKGGGVFQKKYAREALKIEARELQSRMDTLIEEMANLSDRAKRVKRGFAKLEKA
jgi:hypothetical protein